MVACGNGDEEAFVSLYRRYRDRLFNFCRRLLQDRARAEEATQEVFLKIYKARGRYRADHRFSTYLYRVAKNHCLNERGRREHALADRSQEAAAQPTTTPTPDVAAQQSSLREAINVALAALPDAQATALVLCQYEGMSQEEAAAVLEVSESAVKSLVFRARQSLSALLREHLQEEEVRHAVP